jgi:pyrroloquinoline quinone (PQQ) biosynthesis protein C
MVMMQAFRRTGPLKDLSSYPVWLQRVVQQTERDKLRVAGHELFVLMRDARLPKAAMRKFLIGAWPTIEQFPQFMAMNLKKLNVGASAGEDLARRYLIHNIRVEQKHAEHWVEWARSVDLTLDHLKHGENIEGLSALAHWCWYVCDRASLPVAIAATNYAVEGVTGEWSCLVCATSTYAESLPDDIRASATRWLRLHAEYDDTHPWEALEIVATLLGHAPSPVDVEAVRRAIQSTYIYFAMGLDHALGEMLHAGFDETASNASTLGALDAA